MSNAETVVTVTGASGFVGSRIVADLLDRGYTVRGTVRNPDNTEKYGFLMELPGASERLTLHRGKLLEDGSFDQSMQGADYAIHTASPYVMDVKDPQKDLVDPAVKGTLNVLKSANEAGVTRVVVTSSMAAITDEPDSDHVLTEEDWNEKSTLDRNPYYLSKAEAERAAWNFAEETGLDVVVINPFLIIGPSLTPSLNTSNKIFVDLLSGEYPGVMSITWGMVDVRDVSEAHIRAMENPDASGRHICVHHRIAMGDVVELLQEKGYGEGNKLPKFDLACSVGDYTVKLLSYFQPKGVGAYLRTHIGRVPNFDDTKIRDELGLEYRPVEQSIGDTMKDLEKWGHI